MLAVVIVVGLLINGVIAFIGYSIAKAKGRDPMMGAIIGIIFGPLGLIILALLPGQKQVPRGRYRPRGRSDRDYDRGSRRDRDRGYGRRPSRGSRPSRPGKRRYR